MIIAIDGPSGAGKSSVSRAVAERLGFGYLDTGAMYRTVALWALRGGTLDLTSRLVASLTDLAIRISTDPRHPRVTCNGDDVTAEIRTPEVTLAASQVSSIAAVRSRLVAQQQDIVRLVIARSGGVVVEGRDIGSVVCPDADLKIFLTADADVRAARRAAEAPDTAHTVALRDARDAARAVAPLQDPADLPADVVLVDATHAGMSEVIERICALAHR